MEHLEEHQHAYIKGNEVIWVGVFSDHEIPHSENIMNHLSADSYICCCELGYFPSAGDTWDGETFRTPEPEYSEEYYTWLAQQS